MAGSSADPREAYEKILTGNLQRAIDFLKFAEAKNAALLAISSAWVVAIINLECGDKPIPPHLAVNIVLALLFALCAGLLAMISFLPKLNLPSLLGGKRAGPHAKNLLYFGDLSSFSTKSLEQELHTRYLPDEKGHREEYIHDLVVQICVNSEITMRKMFLFRWGMTCISVGGLILLVPIIGMAIKGLATLW